MTVAPPYKLVIFDFDGTLSDSGDWFISIIDDLADRFRFRRVDRNEIETLRRAPNILLIPGTSSVAHLEQNLAVADIDLNDDAMASLNAIGNEVAA